MDLLKQAREAEEMVEIFLEEGNEKAAAFEAKKADSLRAAHAKQEGGDE